jgi:hypothetical protein
MNRNHIALTFVLLFSVISMSAIAQEWVEISSGGVEFNCETVALLIEAHSDESLSKTDGTTFTTKEFFENLVPDCETVKDSTSPESPESESSFNIQVDGNVNLRECAGTSCSIVGQARDGEILAVLGEIDDWYEVIYEGESAWIASWVTSPAPDAIIETDEPHLVDGTTCVIVPSLKRGDMDINFILTGDRQDDIIADLYRPIDTNPLRVNSQLDKTFIDSGDTYVLQTYRWNVSFPTGLYMIELTFDDEIYRIGWNVAERADYNIYIQCS